MIESKRQNIFGGITDFLVMESESSAAGSMHGLLKSGVLQQLMLFLKDCY